MATISTFPFILKLFNMPVNVGVSDFELSFCFSKIIGRLITFSKVYQCLWRKCPASVFACFSFTLHVSLEQVKRMYFSMDKVKQFET